MRQRELKRGATLAWVAFTLGVSAVLLALLAGLGTGRGWWNYGTGLSSLRYLFFVAIAGALLGLFARFRRRDGQMVAVIAILIGIGFAAYLGNFYRLARAVPAIHDVTTNLDDPPQFATLSLRADNLDKIPDMGRPGFAELSPLDRWKAVHQEAYGRLRPVRIPLSPADAIKKAEAIARLQGWEIAVADPAAGRLEATDTTRFFRFKDDVVVRARIGDGGGSIVDVRSVSRVGVSDLGMNAKRIRGFVEALQRSE